jgi:hypothetical protein
MKRKFREDDPTAVVNAPNTPAQTVNETEMCSHDAGDKAEAYINVQTGAGLNSIQHFGMPIDDVMIYMSGEKK